MSDTVHSGAKKAAPKLTIEQEPMADDQAASASDASTEQAAHARGALGDQAVGFIKGLGASLWAYADTHHYTVLYGFIGFVLAVLILTIGLWSTIVIAVFAGVGATLGQIRDGDNGIVNFFSRLFGGKR